MNITFETNILRFMAKAKVAFFCKNCGHNSPKWVGKCPSCGEWNTFEEEVIHKPTATNAKLDTYVKSYSKPVPTLIQEVSTEESPRYITLDDELNRVLGGGIVPGSVVLIGGHPGIGKSTLMLQIAMQYQGTILYVSGEESEEQIKLRAERLSGNNTACYIYTETNVSELLNAATKIDPALIVIDSIQTLASPYIDSPAGSISQIKECTAELQRYAKESGIPIFIIGHITKDGTIAGPKLLEHMVDVVLQFEGEQNNYFRILRTIKNRFGSTDELGIYQMNTDGLQGVPNPSDRLINQYDEEMSGTAIACIVEGMRPILIETQALVTNSVYGNPQRTCTGYDAKRLSMILAVLEKRCGMPFGMKDVFLNIVGGLKVNDPAIDLAIVMALASSFQDIPIGRKLCFAGEIGLTGEVRSVPRVEQRIKEAQRLGFTDVFVSAPQNLTNQNLMKVHNIPRVEILLEHLLS